ncbi:DUF523 domain-containing protein [Pseudomonas borbori]|uniref:Uncharacterized conserved protein YbbK, DUF523 family n=1 Tax=Pseudomonas borbori TaxID=289003 RepID=A0A1I5SVC4_9PSED|nr:DUF523 domain-containing protein [Pseudomonas borbori]SFP74689.1 Uncharacterized conserved protein YbbK, DUF523 family [Pseudomonas borbori]
MQKILVSRCLLGHAVRYDGGAHGPFDLLRRWQTEGRVVALCPEVAGGLPTPRPAAEIPSGQGAQVLDGRLPVLTIEGEDVTAAFVAGAEQALALVRQHGIRLALLKARSPSCGNRENYDGSFGGVKVAGEGVTAAALRRAGVRVFSEEELAAAEAALRELEALWEGPGGAPL